MFFLQPEQQTEDLLALTESWFHLLSKHPMDMICNISAQPFPELHCGALGIFTVSAQLFLTTIMSSLCHWSLSVDTCVCFPGHCHTALGSEVNDQHSQFHGVRFGSFHGSDEGGQRCQIWTGGSTRLFINNGGDTGKSALHPSEDLSQRGTLLCFSCGLRQHRGSRMIPTHSHYASLVFSWWLSKGVSAWRI